jgi:hypothetical protein
LRYPSWSSGFTERWCSPNGGREYVIVLVGSLRAMGMPVIHVTGPRGIFSGEMARYSGAFLFFWTFFVLGVTGMFSFILSVRGLWSLQRGQSR